LIGGGRQEIELLDPRYLGALQQAFDQPATNPAAAMFGRDDSRTKQSDSAEFFEANRAGNFAFGFSDYKVREIVLHSVERQIARREQTLDGC
jgi:hypothetical protein